MLIQILYAAIAVIALFSALMVVLSPQAVYSALYLVMTMVAIAGLFVMMNAQLAAAFQIIVYAGAIMVLFLFVIMLLNVGVPEPSPSKVLPIRWIGFGLALALVIQFVAMFADLAARNVYTLQGAKSVQIQPVAHLLLTRYIYAFEMTSVLLLIAVVGAVVLARRFLIQGADTSGSNVVKM